MPVSPVEYNAIEVIYINADENVTKDEFCKMWAKMNRNRIKAYIEKRKKQEELSALKDKCWAIYEKLLKVDVCMKWKPAINYLGSRDETIIRKTGVTFDMSDVWTFTNRLRKYLTA